MHWPKLSTRQVNERLFAALSANLNYRTGRILGIPATFLDAEVFYEDAPFLKDAPYLSMLIDNPNHIGCHTLPGKKEEVFAGTQEIEKDLIRICAEEIFGAAPGGYDGYVASGGTEANIEALWIYRNYFMQERSAGEGEIALLFSGDSHYSFYKAANLLQLRAHALPVHPDTREILWNELRNTLRTLTKGGTKYFIVNVNLATTMFGSVDDITRFTDILEEEQVEFRLHIDAAFGGFIFPFTSGDSNYSFSNPHVSSITVDGHKLLQSPYGTGIFLVRKNLMQYVCTREASYVQGNDYTLCGSRSGANAASVWMILHSHGSDGWKMKMQQLLHRTGDLCDFLDSIDVRYYRNPALNIITIRAAHITPALAKKYFLVPDNHQDPQWYKIVMMPHVRQGLLDEFRNDLVASLPFAPTR